MADSLLQKAKKQKSDATKMTVITDEHIELALAWCRDEVTYTQVNLALAHNSQTQTYITLARALKKHFKESNVKA